MVDDALELIRLYLPKYLTPAQRDELYSELKRFPDIESFYLPAGSTADELLQGDVWQGFVVINFESLHRRTVAGLLLSNSCDVSPENRRSLPPHALFSPLVSLTRYEELLRQAGLSKGQIDSTLTSIRKQHVTNIFYLPSAPYGPPESIVLLDNIHSHPLEHFFVSDRTHLHRLNQIGFYILLLKLSIHFCRFQEGVARFV